MTVHTANAPITGIYRSSRTLLLQTSNQPILTNITLLNEDTPRHPTNLTMTTANAYVTCSCRVLLAVDSVNGFSYSAIDTTISLRTPSPSDKGGAFAVSSKTQNGALALRFQSQPIDSKLTLTAQTSNAPAQVHLHPAYEGDFSMGTSHGPMELTVYEDLKDPSGRGRKRHWTVVERIATVFKGRVWWSYTPTWDGQGSRGSADVQTSNSAVQLTV